MTAALWALIAVPLATGALLVAVRHRADRFAAPVALTVNAVTLGLAGSSAVARPRVSAPMLAGLPVSFAVDGLSAVMIVLVAAVSLAVLAFAAADLGAGEARARFFGLMLVFVAAMLATVTADSLLGLLMAWELMGAMSYALIGFWWRDASRAASGAVAFLTTRAADLGLYLAAGAALAGGEGLRLDGLAGLPSPWLHVVAAGIAVAALGKSAQLPFSFWLSRAMAGPSPVSALLHSATMVAAGGYLLLRVQPLLHASGWAAPAVAWTGAVTALLLGAVAVAQRDLKQLLAASTCAQIGFIVLAAGVGARPGGTAHLVAHAATKSLLFLVAGALLTALGTKDLDALRGAGRRYRPAGALFAVGALTLAGVPPLALWVTKDEILAVAGEGLYAAGLAAAVLSAAYAGRALGLVLARPHADAEAAYDRERRGTRTIPRRMTAPLVPLAGCAALLGVVGLHPIWTGFAAFVGGETHEPEPWEPALSAVLAIAVTAAAIRRSATPVRPERTRPSRLPVTGVPARWLDLERLARVVVAEPALAVARVCARADDRVVDGGVRGSVWLTGRLARLVRVRFEWSLDGAVAAVGAAGRRLGGLARLPQTGRLHQYYAQAVVALLLAAIILLLVR